MSSAAIRSSCLGGVHVGAVSGSAEEGTGNTWDSAMVASWLSRAAIVGVIAQTGKMRHVTSAFLPTPQALSF